jgi:hypothetical protein
MDKAPKIGAQVRYHSKTEWWDRVCTGVVTKVHPKVEYDDEDFDWETDEGMPPVKGPAPEKDWQVTMQVVRPLPSWWPYGDEQDKFCPSVEDLEVI